MPTTPLLIARSDFNGRVELSANMIDPKINPRILEAQDFDLRKLMGNAFYYDLINNSADAKYVTLLDGGSYTVNSIEYNFEGIKPVLVYFATARIIKKLDYHFTPNGFMQKRNDFSDHVDPKEITYQSNQFENQAKAYWDMCELFLDNSTNYSLWKNNCACDNERVSPSPVVKAVGGRNEYDNYYYTRYGRQNHI